MNAFYDNVYTNHFNTEQNPAVRLTIFVGLPTSLEEFLQRTTDAFECRFTGCRAKCFVHPMKDLQTDKWQLKYRFEPHSKDMAHSHSSVPSPPTNIEKFVPTDKAAFARNLPKGENSEFRRVTGINVRDLEPADFKTVAVYETAGPQFRNAQRLRAPNGFLFGKGTKQKNETLGHYKRWFCIHYYDSYHCMARAFTRGKMAVFDRDEEHANHGVSGSEEESSEEGEEECNDVPLDFKSDGADECDEETILAEQNQSLVNPLDDESIEEALAEISSWTIVKCANGSNYAVLDMEDWEAVQDIADPEEKFAKFKQSIAYFGSDATGIRPTNHNTQFSFTGIDAYLWQRRLQNKKNITIVFDGPNDHTGLMYVFESLLIDQARRANIQILNIADGHDINKYITNFDTSKFGSVFDLLIWHALASYTRIYVTSDAQIRATQFVSMHSQIFENFDYRFLIESIANHLHGMSDVEQLIQDVAEDLKVCVI